jgi:ATP-dependent protease ClpP protease subunit
MGTRKNKTDTIHDLHQNDILIERREIWLVNNHPDDGDINPMTAAQFVKNLRLLDTINNEPILVHMLAGNGGCVDSGMIIFDAIGASKSIVRGLVYGSAQSMTSVILQACDVRILHKNSFLMLHYGSIQVDAGWVGTKSLMEKINIDQERDLNIYISRAKEGVYFKGWKDSKIRTFIKNKLSSKEDWYISASESINMGLADGILGDKDFEI